MDLPCRPNHHALPLPHAQSIRPGYQERHTIIPELAPHELLQALLEESGQRQADLLPIFGSRGRVSDAVNGKRTISKEQAKRLGEYFRVSPAAFI